MDASVVLALDPVKRIELQRILAIKFAEGITDEAMATPLTKATRAPRVEVGLG